MFHIFFHRQQFRSTLGEGHQQSPSDGANSMLGTGSLAFLYYGNFCSEVAYDSPYCSLTAPVLLGLFF